MNKLNKIYKPEISTYFIILNKAKDNVLSYGIVLPNQVLTTKETNIDTYTDENKWKEVLESFKIELL
tara:strand:- start:305 stop:505 length:201 start_codon:yes stop_codon:yes gene_type:complete